jgi:hypothetical protein
MEEVNPKEELLIKRYVTGNSFDDLLFDAKTLGLLSTNPNILKEIHTKYLNLRKRQGIKDLYIAILAWTIFLAHVLSIFVIGSTNYFTLFISLTAGLPFFRSYLNAHKNKPKFE